jgi:Uncharacterized protein conserved in bacteria (DUF2213)
MRLFDSVQVRRNVVSTRPKRFRGEMSRVGVFPYLINGEVIWQYRPEDEVFDPNSVESLLDAVMTIDHPESDDDTALEMIHGSVINVFPNRETLALDGDFLLVTKESDRLAKQGSPLSPMYDADIVEDRGSYMGKPFSHVQKNIRYTSLGLVSEARQGNTVKVFYQLSKDSGGVVTTDSGLTYNASIITTNDMKVTSKIIKDSVAALETPTAAPAIDLTIPANVDIPSGVSAETFSQITGLQSQIDMTIDAKTDVTAVETVVTSDVVAEIPPSIGAESLEEEEIEVIAQITDVGGVLVDRAFLDEVITVANDAVTRGVMSLNDAIYHGQADISGVKRAILVKAGVTLNDTDDVHTAYRIFTNVSSSYVTAVPAKTTERQTIGDSVSTMTRKAVVAPKTPLVTHPTTHGSSVGAANVSTTPGFVSFDSIGL